MKAIAIVGLLLVATQAALRSQDSLTAAKDLYASAAYEEALSTLTRLAGDGSTAPDIARQVAEYRAFSLYALGRTGEAESVAESIIRKEPLTTLGAPDASPRLELMFSNVRKRLLPVADPRPVPDGAICARSKELGRGRTAAGRSAADDYGGGEARRKRRWTRRPEYPGRWIPRAGPIHGCATDIHASGGRCSPGCSGDTFSSLGGDSLLKRPLVRQSCPRRRPVHPASRACTRAMTGT